MRWFSSVLKVVNCSLPIRVDGSLQEQIHLDSHEFTQENGLGIMCFPYFDGSWFFRRGTKLATEDRWPNTLKWRSSIWSACQNDVYQYDQHCNDLIETWQNHGNNMGTIWYDMVWLSGVPPLVAMIYHISRLVVDQLGDVHGSRGAAEPQATWASPCQG